MVKKCITFSYLLVLLAIQFANIYTTKFLNKWVLSLTRNFADRDKILRILLTQIKPK